MKGRHEPFPSVPARALAEAVGRSEPGLEQMAGESEGSYRAFRQYCLMGPEVLAADIAKACGVSKSFVGTARARHHWTARIEEWWRQREKSADLGGGGGKSEKGNEEWEQRRNALREEEWKMHSALLAAAEEALGRWAASDKVPSLGEVAKVMELASKLGRLAAGLPLAHMEVSGNPEAPLRVEIEAALERAYGGEVVDTVTVEVPEQAGAVERVAGQVNEGARGAVPCTAAD